MPGMKNVTFNESQNRVYVLDDDYGDYRKMYWEFIALDRMRFQKHIEEIGVVINSVLTYVHRCKIFKERFEIKDYILIKRFYLFLRLYIKLY
jgi:Phosphatase-1 catalytic subunit binding region